MNFPRGIAALLVAGATLTATPAGATPGLGWTPSVEGAPAAVPGPAATASQSPAPAGAAASIGTPEVGASLAVPNLATQAWVLADLDTGEILAQQSPHLQLRPASTQKLLTALAVAPRLDPQQLYRADKADEVAEGNRVVLYDGLTYKVSDLIHAMLLPSANDAAMALAKANGGAAATVAQMNEEAARLGANDTHAVNPSGLDADGQYTSAHDLATIGRAALADPEIASYLKLAVVDFPGKATAGGGRVIYSIYNLNRMLRDGFKGPLGGKSGYTTLARNTFVAGAERDGHRLIVSLMNVGGNTYRTAETALNWGFAHRDQLVAVDQLPEPTSPAPTFQRTATALPEQPADEAGDLGGTSFTTTAPPTSGEPAAVPPASAGSGDSAGSGAQSGMLSGVLSAVLTALTLLMLLLVIARARVFWMAHKRRARRGYRGTRVTRRPARNVDLRTGRPGAPARRGTQPARSNRDLVGPRS